MEIINDDELKKIEGGTVVRISKNKIQALTDRLKNRTRTTSNTIIDNNTNSNNNPTVVPISPNLKPNRPCNTIVSSPNRLVVKKPVIYLYPTQEEKINVVLKNSDRITCSYPKYSNGWEVIAKPNGDLTYTKDNKELYSLYYESDRIANNTVKNDGFVIKGEDSAKFLEEKLALLGLTPREAEEFIIYWLPQLEANKYNYIRFETASEINENMQLEITPAPDTIIRVIMTFKGLDNPISVTEQKLEKVSRKGFVVVEWGGSVID